MSSPAVVVAVGERALPGYSGNDPHVWHDPETSLAMLEVVSNQLEMVLPVEEWLGCRSAPDVRHRCFVI